MKNKNIYIVKYYEGQPRFHKDVKMIMTFPFTKEELESILMNRPETWDKQIEEKLEDLIKSLYGEA